MKGTPLAISASMKFFYSFILIAFIGTTAFGDAEDYVPFKGMLKVVQGKILLKSTKGKNIELTDQAVIVTKQVPFSHPLKDIRKRWNFNREIKIELLKTKDKIVFSIPGPLINTMTQEFSVPQPETEQNMGIQRKNEKTFIKTYTREATEDCIYAKYCSEIVCPPGAQCTAAMKAECKGKKDVRQIVNEYRIVRVWRIVGPTGEATVRTDYPENVEEAKKVKDLSVCAKAK